MRLRTGRDHIWFKDFYKNNYIDVGFGLDIKLTRALSVTTNIDFYKYKVNFKLFK